METVKGNHRLGEAGTDNLVHAVGEVKRHLFITLQKYKKISRKPNAFPIIFKKSRVTLYPVPAVTQRKYQQVLDAERDQQSQQLAEKDKKIEELQAKYKGEEFRHQQDNQEKDRIIRQKDSIINDYRERIGHYLSTLSELLRAAVRAVLDYVQDGYRSFSYRQECDVKRYINSQPDKEAAAGTVLNASLPFLKSDECEKVKGQLSYIVQDMKEERQQSQSRGIHI
jgi:hypothetical protein